MAVPFKSVLIVCGSPQEVRDALREHGPAVVLRLGTCERALHYLKHYKDPTEVWVSCASLGDWDSLDLKRTINNLHPGTTVTFVATAMKHVIEKVSPQVNWRIVQPSVD